MSDLRNHLFETLEALKDSEKPMEIDRAKAICSVAHQLIESAKVEVKFIETTGQDKTGQFFDESRPVTNGRALPT
jgi:hypothetical protein